MYKSENLFDIFGVNGRHGYLAAEVIQDLLQVEVCSSSIKEEVEIVEIPADMEIFKEEVESDEVGLSDGFPRRVCSVCLDKLTDFKLFKDQCLESCSSFRQEFGHIIELAEQRKGGGRELNQDPLVCSSSIKEEVEIVEIPADMEIFKEEVESDEPQATSSPTHSMAFDLDVVTFDDEDNVLCLGTKEELEYPDALTAVPLSSQVKGQVSRKRNKHGQFVKTKKLRGSGGK